MSTWTGENKSLAFNEFILLEDGFFLLQENDSSLILEQSSNGSVTWFTASKTSSSWSNEIKTGIDDVLGLEGSSDILGTEAGYSVGLEQSDSTGVTWSGTNKS